MDNREIVAALEKMHPAAECELNFETPFQLLVAVILSAQCTDKRVNEVTSVLFKKYATPQDYAVLAQEVLEREIKSCGYYRAKAKHIIETAKAILADFVRHNEITPSFGESVKYREMAKRVGMDFKGAYMGAMKAADDADARYAARNTARSLDKVFGSHKGMMLSWGDEYGLNTLRAIRSMVEIYHEEGFLFAVNSQSGYLAGANLADLWWPPFSPDHRSAAKTAKYNETAPDGRMGWYASQHVGAENPAFARRQYGMGPYLAGYGCNYNYAHHLQGWNDIEMGLYRPMNFVYGSGNGCVDTLAWEGFREAIDDIRYATLLKTTALKLIKEGAPEARYAARIALKLFADAKGDDYDLTTFRYEMINHIQKLRAFEAK